jgi:hypothetical protein
MQARAEICNALMGGTEAMRAAGRRFLPQEPKEKDADWLSRRDRSVLFPAFRDAVDSMVGKPLGKPIAVEEVPEALAEALENADLAGRDLDTFARAWFAQSLVDGIGWALVDYPRVPPGASLADERALNARPYLVHIPLSMVCGWKTETAGGRHRLVQFRWREAFEEPDGEFDTKRTERVKVWEPGLVRTFVNSGGGWAEDPALSGPVSIGEVPIVCFAPGRTGFFTAEPPLEDLAWLNVQHWQSSSDQRHILHHVRVPVLTADDAGPDYSGKEGEVEIGANRLVTGIRNLHYVEHNGAAIGAGRQDLLDIKEEMRLIAGKVLTRQAGGDRSATEAGLEARDGGSKLRQWTWAFQDCLEEALRFMALWGGQETMSGTVTLDTEWDSDLDAQTLGVVLQARLAGELSRRTWLWNAKRHGILEAGTSPDDEAKEIETERAATVTAEPGAKFDVDEYAPAKPKG